jgi:putative FmdB family regulatory protein
MPIYEYKCKSCGEIGEYLVGTSKGEEEIICKNCGSSGLEKVMSVAAFSMGEKRAPGRTCCGREERCETPPCSTDNVCRRSSE